MMLWLYNMDRILPGSPNIAFVVQSFLFFTCPKGGFPSIRHNKIRDLTASLLAEVCNEIEVEPIYNQSLVSSLLWPLQTPKMEHVLTFQQMVFGVVSVKRLLLMWKFSILMLQVIDPLMSTAFLESMNYLRSILMKLVSMRLNTIPLHLQFFQPQVEWLMKLHFYKRLASLYSDKWDTNYATVMGWVRWCLSFSLLRSAIRCLREV